VWVTLWWRVMVTSKRKAITKWIYVTSSIVNVTFSRLSLVPWTPPVKEPTKAHVVHPCPLQQAQPFLLCLPGLQHPRPPLAASSAAKCISRSEVQTNKQSW
jgi:hypothetical protein